SDGLGGVDGDVAARKVLALLVRVAVDRVRQQLGADPAVVQERVALAWRAVASDAQALVVEANQQLQQLALHAGYLGLEPAVARQVVKAGAPLDLPQLLHGGLLPAG